MRDKIAFLQGEQRSRYFGKTLPLSTNDTTAWNTGRAAARGDGERLPAVPRGRGGGHGEITRHAALTMQRADALHRRADAVPRDRLPALRAGAVVAPAPALRRGRAPRHRRGARQGFARGRGWRLHRGRDVRPRRAHAGRVPLRDDRAADGFRRGAAAHVDPQGARAARAAGARRGARHVPARHRPHAPDRRAPARGGRREAPRTASSTWSSSRRASAGASTA